MKIKYNNRFGFLNNKKTLKRKEENRFKIRAFKLTQDYFSPSLYNLITSSISSRDFNYIN